MREDLDLQIVTNNEEISFNQYMERLKEIYRDCNQEVYYSEILMPLFRMCCPDGIKIVPVYDDRHTGKKDASKCSEEEKSSARKRMETICAKGEDDKYIVPDFIFVPDSYTFDNPIKPVIMVETKKPIFLKDGAYYGGVEKYLNDSKINAQLVAEARACDGKLIFTDGITWMILEIKANGDIGQATDPICFLEKYEGYYYKTQRSDTKYIEKRINLEILGQEGEACVKAEPNEWEMLKSEIRDLIKREVEYE